MSKFLNGNLWNYFQNNSNKPSKSNGPKFTFLVLFDVSWRYTEKVATKARMSLIHCYASCEIERNVTKHLYQCSSAHNSPVKWPTLSEEFKI